MRRTTFAMLVLILVVPFVMGFAEFDNKPFPDFTLTQNTTFTLDFNATNISDGSPVPEDGRISYDVLYAEVQSKISPDSVFSFDPTTGLLAYTPSNADATKNFTVRFLLIESEDEPSLDEIIIGFEIGNINDPPQITNSTPEPLIDTAENLTINLTASALDIDAPYGENLTIHWNIYWPFNESFESPILVNTTNESIDPYGDTSILNYTVGFCDAPIILIEALARDEAGLEDAVNWTVNVENVNRNITLVNATIQTQTLNESTEHIANFTYDEYFVDPDDLECGDETLTFTLNKANQTSIIVNQTTGAVTFNVTPKWSGNETVSITVTDAEGTNVTSNEFIIEVLQVPDPPIGFDPEDQTAYEFAPFEMFIRFEDADLPFGDVLSYTLNDTSLFNVEWYNQSGNASYARMAFIPAEGQAGSYTFMVTANDTFEETANATASFNLTIVDNNPPIIDTPVIIPMATQGEPYSVIINASDADADPISWFALLNVSINGSLNSSVLGIGPLNTTIGAYPFEDLSATEGNLSFTPTNDDVGNHSITIIAVDPYGARTNTTTLLRVVNVNDAPYDLKPDGIIIKAKELTQWNGTVTVEDPDFIWGDYVTVTVNDSNIDITNTTADGSAWRMTWDIPLGASENRSIMLNATDIEGASITTIFTLEILPALPPKLILPIVNLTAQANTPYRTIIRANDPNDDPLIFTFNETVWSAYDEPEGLNRTIITANYTDIQVGNYSINVTVTDIDGMSDSVIVDFMIEPFNLPPELLDLRDIAFVNGTYTNYTFSVDDPEDDQWNAYFESSAYSWLEITKIDNNTFVIGATPNQSVIGLQQPILVINQTSFPPRNSTYTLNISVFSDPQAPEILSRNPTTDVAGNEGTSRVFTATIDDLNFPGPGSNESDRVTLVWELNDEVIRTKQINETTNEELNLFYDYCLAPGGTLRLTATDLWNLSVSTSWNLDITNVNREPYFGEKRFSYDVISNRESSYLTYGDWIRSGVVDTGAELRLEEESIPGTVTSPAIYMGRRSNINRANITSVNGSSVGPIYYQLRFNSDSTNTLDPFWTNWSNLVPLGSYPGNLTPRQYVQIRLFFNETTNHTNVSLSTLTNATLTYEFANQLINSTFTGFDYWYLDDYFTDLDYIECLQGNLTATGEDSPPKIVFDIDETDRSVDLLTDTAFGYIHTTSFFYSDQESNASSNVFEIKVVERPDQVNVPQPTTGGSGGGGSSVTIITEPEEIEVDVPEPLDIIAPGTLTMTENQTISIPISIINRWNETLENIEIFAESDNELINLTLGLERIASLLPDANETFNLSITSFATFGEYAVNLMAIVEDPDFNTTATILINSIELGQRGDAEYDTRLSFARDIVESNPRCIELNEHIQRSRELVAQGESEEAILLLDDIVENCRYLVNLEASTLFPLDERSWFEKILQDTSSQTQLYAITIIIVNTLLFSMVGVYLFKNH
jgi:hypothetical protein